MAQQSAQPGEHAAEIVADGGEDDVGSIAITAFEIAAAEVALGFHVTNDGFDCRATLQFTLDDAEDAALLTGDEDPPWIGGVVTAISFVDKGAFDGAAGELLGVVDDGAKRVTVIGVAGQAPGVEHELATGRAAIGGHDRGLDADLWTTPALQEETTKG